MQKPAPSNPYCATFQSTAYAREAICFLLGLGFSLVDSYWQGPEARLDFNYHCPEMEINIHCHSNALGNSIRIDAWILSLSPVRRDWPETFLLHAESSPRYAGHDELWMYNGLRGRESPDEVISHWKERVLRALCGEGWTIFKM